MDKEIKIRKAEIKDYDEVHSLIMQVHKLHVNEREDIYNDIDPLEKKEYIDELLKKESIYLIAEIENKIEGICFAKIKEIKGNKLMKDRKIMHIEDICVNKNVRRHGIGKKLYMEITKIAKSKKINNIELLVWGFNKDAIGFYNYLGLNIKNIRLEQKIL